MRRWIWLFLVPFSLSAYDYYCDQDAQSFQAHIHELPSQIPLDQKKKVCLTLKLPKTYKLHNIVYDSKDSYFVWEKNKEIQKETGEKNQQLELEFSIDPQVQGQHFLNLPLLHLVDQSDPQKFVTLYPPLVPIEIAKPSKSSPDYLLSKNVLSLDLRRPIEMDADNEKKILEPSQNENTQLRKEHSFSWAQKALYRFMIALMGLFIVFKVYPLVKARFKKRVSQRHVDVYQQALKELEVLKEMMLIQKGHYEEFYIKLTLIIRRYIEGKFQIKAPEQTTPEFLEEILNKKVFKATLNTYLSDFLKFADLVKFAKLHPLPDECMQAQTLAFNFLKESEDQCDSQEDDATGDALA